MNISQELKEQAVAAREASLLLASLENTHKNKILHAIAQNLRQQTESILSANCKDLKTAAVMVEDGTLSQSAYKRVALTADKVEQMACNMESVASLPDPVGRVQAATQLDEGLDLYRVSCPIGVILVIFESRPDVVVQISALAIKSGNAVILKGGKEAAHSNRKLVEVIQQTLTQFDEIPNHAVSLLETREAVSQLVALNEYLDLIIPRGGNKLIRFIQENAKVPVLAHADGICHVYLDVHADPDKSLEIVVDSKTEYPAVCNAMETLLVHQSFSDAILKKILEALHDKGVELRVCAQTRKRLADVSDLPLLDASEDDWSTEYTDLILSVKTVESFHDAVKHINHFGSKHTDAIVTENQDDAEHFLNEVDAANVFWNASTRFADGFRYGLGAEVGVSTCKTHARGPVGLEGLVIYKYKLYGEGQIVAPYSKGQKSFSHKTINLS